MALRGLGIRHRWRLPVVRKKRSILRPRVSFGHRLRIERFFTLRTLLRRRRAGWRCSAPVPGTIPRLAEPRRELHCWRLSSARESPEGLKRRCAPRSIRIASAPLNSDRLPSKRRRQGQYLMGSEGRRSGGRGIHLHLERGGPTFAKRSRGGDHFVHRARK